jgi:hypothetical protein
LAALALDFCAVHGLPAGAQAPLVQCLQARRDDSLAAETLKEKSRAARAARTQRHEQRAARRRKHVADDSAQTATGTELPTPQLPVDAAVDVVQLLPDLLLPGLDAKPAPPPPPPPAAAPVARPAVTRALGALRVVDDLHVAAGQQAQSWADDRSASSEGEGEGDEPDPALPDSPERDEQEAPLPARPLPAVAAVHVAEDWGALMRGVLAPPQALTDAVQRQRASRHSSSDDDDDAARHTIAAELPSQASRPAVDDGGDDDSAPVPEAPEDAHSPAAPGACIGCSVHTDAVLEQLQAAFAVGSAQTVTALEALRDEAEAAMVHLRTVSLDARYTASQQLRHVRGAAQEAAQAQKARAVAMAEAVADANLAGKEAAEEAMEALRKAQVPLVDIMATLGLRVEGITAQLRARRQAMALGVEATLRTGADAAQEAEDAAMVGTASAVNLAWDLADLAEEEAQRAAATAAAARAKTGAGMRLALEALTDAAASVLHRGRSASEVAADVTAATVVDAGDVVGIVADSAAQGVYSALDTVEARVERARQAARHASSTLERTQHSLHRGLAVVESGVEDVAAAAGSHVVTVAEASAAQAQRLVELRQQVADAVHERTLSITDALADARGAAAARAAALAAALDDHRAAAAAAVADAAWRAADKAHATRQSTAQLAGSLSAGVRERGAGVQSSLHDIRDRVSATASEATSHVMGASTDALQRHAQTAREKAASGAQAAGDTATRAASTASQLLQEVRSDVAAAAREGLFAAQDASGALRSSASRLREGALDAGSAFTSAHAVAESTTAGVLAALSERLQALRMAAADAGRAVGDAADTAGVQAQDLLLRVHEAVQSGQEAMRDMVWSARDQWTGSR